ncbi:hypothetical protein, partial [Staphylococcus epidermidis]|uniref:hypothetical protein n=1 Tax=Staphylococcus epidermidis TaxID=1282 RepID=UPI0021B19CBC
MTLTLSPSRRSPKQKHPSNQTQKSHKYHYLYYQILNHPHSQTPNLHIKYKHKKPKSHIQKPHLQHLYQHILAHANKKPYILKDANKIHLYPPPYMIYGHDDVEG